MAKFKINEGYSDEKIVEADEFDTNGEFVDFLARAKGGNVFRKKSADVKTIERVAE